MIDDPRPGGSRLPEPERRTWRDLRSRFFQAEARSPEFDPRRVLRLQGQALADWRDRRRAWLQIEIFADDARVDLNQ
jgi:hypothetical protein